MPNRSAVSLVEASSTADLRESAKMLMDEHMALAAEELRSRYGIYDFPDNSGAMNGNFSREAEVRVLLALDESDGAVGVGAVRPLTGDRAEIKRMYVRSPYRALGIGAQLLDALIGLVQSEAMASVILLDTCRYMTAAQRLYRGRGFREIDPYGDSEVPARFQQHWLFFERSVWQESGGPSSSLKWRPQSY